MNDETVTLAIKKVIEQWNKEGLQELFVVDTNEVASGFIGEVLNQITHLADYEIKDTNYFFDMFVIRL